MESKDAIFSDSELAGFVTLPAKVGIMSGHCPVGISAPAIHAIHCGDI